LKATKVKTKAAKIKARKGKPGRPRRKGAVREPNGRISRSGIRHEPADKTAIEARMRHMGLSRDQAQDQKAATFIGYLNLMGREDGLSDSQYEAATNFLSLRDAYLRSLKAPGVVYDGEGCSSSSDEVTEDYEDWAKRTKERYDDCRKAIQEEQNNSRENLWAALDLVVIRDQWLPHMIGPTRMLCNALGRFFRTA